MNNKKVRREILKVVKENPGIGFWKLLPEIERRLSNRRHTVKITDKVFQRQLSRMVNWGKLKFNWKADDKEKEPLFFIPEKESKA